MVFKARQHFCIDWKTPGREFIGFFQSDYPELDFLQTEEFEQLIDTLANESPPNCFDAIAAFVAPHGYGLWHLDQQDDAYRLALVPDAKVNYFLNFWERVSAPDEDCETVPERLGTAGCTTAPGAPFHASPATRPIVARGESFYHSDFGGIRLSTPVHFVEFWKEDISKSYSELMDFSVWPPRKIPSRDLLKQFSPKDVLYPEHASGKNCIWGVFGNRRGKKGTPYKLLQIDSYEPLRMRPAVGAPLNYDLIGGKAGIGNSYFFILMSTPLRTDHTTYHLVRLTGGRYEIVTSVPSNGTIVPISETELLIFEENHNSCAHVNVVNAKSSTMSSKKFSGQFA